jgi:hypothetical protein
MTSSPILEVHKYIFNKLQNNQLLKTALNIYNQIPKNSPFPYLYLGKFSLNVEQLSGIEIIELSNQLQLYAQNNDNAEIINWAQQIRSSLEAKNIPMADGKMKYIKFQSMNFDVMNDGKTFQLVMNFKTKLHHGNIICI